MKIIVIPTKPVDKERAARLPEYVTAAWTAPITEETFFQFLAFTWLLARAHERMLSFWKYGANPPN